MAPTALVDFSLSTVDLAFAVSQQNLNQGLAEYIQGLGATVKWAFDTDDNDKLSTPKDWNNPDISFTGTLAPPIQPDSGAPVWIVDLSNAGARNQVTFNLTFEDGATFTDHRNKKTYTQKAKSRETLWVIPFQVNLTLAALSDTSKVPKSLRDRLDILHGNYGHVFDLSQVLLDLQTLASTVDPKKDKPEDISPYEWTMIMEGMSRYLKEHSGDVFTQEPSAGYMVTHNTSISPTQPLPTYTPTAADFVIVPSDANNGGASALVFVMMAQSAPMPRTPANAFTDVTLIADANITPGVALISSPRFMKFIQDDFGNANIQRAIGHYVKSIASKDVPTSWVLSENDPRETTATPLTPSADNGQAFLSITMRTKESRDETPFIESQYIFRFTTNSSAKACFGSLQAGTGYRAVVLSGTMSMTVSQEYVYRLPDKWTSPQFDWNWSANFAIESANASDGQSGGGVQFALKPDQSSFPEEPETIGEGSGSWLSVVPSKQDFISHLLAPVIKELPNAFRNQLGSLTALGNFVFPGGGTFTFQTPAVNNVHCLYSTIQYQNPN
ncbi:hypothetical protein B0I37DRAFT_354157 [Chaetomium sp. MPI-CAGE-AT-0009]|nr:hypothetical protein B0I37DRAFT_354157 [Chaetomium sp. MPI-CAGE-AT-0009]